ncbi:hypothetical protein J4377_03355 [Halomonas sp. XH26]|uniref:hypothetical protein n=1 Tax=Halomonas sp. XH26 TaxID=2557993 RepID=UPI00209D2325|nr:hypothetical protein [Halomonas sp. XH26]UTA80534.1 hypothetical protein J4377_03355 [Halomonas sp. XH26]
MDSNLNAYVTGNALKRISFILDKYLSNELEDNNKDNECFREAIRLMLKSCDYLMNSDGDFYENVPTWNNVLESVSLGNRFDQDAVVEYFCFLYIYSNEAITAYGEGSPVEEALWLTKKSFELLVKIPSGKEYEEKINKKIYIYDNKIRYRLIEERAVAKFEDKLATQVKEAIKEEHELIKDMDKRLKVNAEVLESIEDETGLTSIFSGMKDFSKQIKSNLRRVRGVLNKIIFSMYITPIFAFLFYIAFDPGYGLFLSGVSMMFVLGYFLRINLRKEDQYEQMLAKIENRIAISIFHKYRIGEMDSNEALSATEKFHGLMYKDLETSEWNAPDVSDNLIEIIKAIKK